MASEFKHLEYIPLDEDNLVVNEDPESNLRSKSCINLGFVGLNTIGRLRNISSINSAQQQGSSTFLDLTYSLESVLINLLTLESISNPQHTDVTEHYTRRQTAISANKILPSFGYCQNLTFTGFKPWAGFYSSLSYYINLLEDYEEYYTPSEVVYYASKSLLNYSKGVAYNAYINQATVDFLLLSEFYDAASALIDDDTFVADKKIYDLSKNIILSSPLIREVYSELKFYTEWIVKVLDWIRNIEQQSIDTEIKENASTNSERAKNTLLKVVNALYENGFNRTFEKNIAAKYIKQTIPSNMYGLLQELSRIRVQSNYVPEENPTTLAEELVIELYENTSQFRNIYDYNKSSNIILEGFAPPAGYALFLIMVAATCVNRAYILAYKNIRSTENIFLTDTYTRIIKLLGYAGILLIKSSLPHVQLLGVNILRTYRIYLTDIDPNNLLDL